MSTRKVLSFSITTLLGLADQVSGFSGPAAPEAGSEASEPHASSSSTPKKKNYRGAESDTGKKAKSDNKIAVAIHDDGGVLDLNPTTSMDLNRSDLNPAGTSSSNQLNVENFEDLPPVLPNIPFSYEPESWIYPMKYMGAGGLSGDALQPCGFHTTIILITTHGGHAILTRVSSVSIVPLHVHLHRVVHCRVKNIMHRNTLSNPKFIIQL